MGVSRSPKCILLYAPGLLIGSNCVIVGITIRRPAVYFLAASAFFASATPYVRIFTWLQVTSVAHGKGFRGIEEDTAGVHSPLACFLRMIAAASSFALACSLPDSCEGACQN